jgi:hypothetical protein
MSKSNGHSVAGIASGAEGSMTKDPGFCTGMDVLDARGKGIDTFMARAVEQVIQTGSAATLFAAQGDSNGK